MVESRTLALDAMGGDHGPEVVIPGAAISLVRHPQLSFIFFGAEARIHAVLDQHAALKAKSQCRKNGMSCFLHLNNRESARHFY